MRSAAHQLSVADELPDNVGHQLDRWEQVLAGRDMELNRLRSELAQKTLYVDELQATLDSQARELEAFDARLRQMECWAANQPKKASTEPAKPGLPVPLLIRIRNGPHSGNP